MKTKKKVLFILIPLLCIGLFYYVINKPYDMKYYMKYKISITEDTTKKDILSLCYEIDRGVLNNGISYISYNSEKLSEYLYDVNSITSIDELGDNTLYVSYKTNKNQNVVLCYNDDGFVNLGFYDEKRDLLIGVTPDGVTKY